MERRKNWTVVRDLAVIGARTRIAELKTEIQSIVEAFPELQEQRGLAGGHQAVAASNDAPGGKRLHWMQTPEGRAKMSVIQKKAWRKRRAEQ